MEPILVTGASGRTGNAVALQLLERGRRVRAIVRSEDARSRRLQEAGADIAEADLFDPEQLLAAMRGVRRAYYCPPWDPNMLHSASAFAAAAREAKLEAIVGLSQWLASPDHPALLTRQHWLADRMFGALPGIAHVAVNPGYFADNYLGDAIEFAAQLGTFPWPYGESANAPPSNEDIARVAVAALLDPERHAGRSYRPTGPALLTGGDMARVLGQVLRRRVVPLAMPPWLFERAMRDAGYSPFQVSSVRVYIEEHRRGTFAFGAPNDVVRELTGRPAESFETIVRRYAKVPIVQRTPGNFFRLAGRLMQTVMIPGRDLGRFERMLGAPKPARPHLAIDDDEWTAAHGMQHSHAEPRVPEAVAI